MGAGKVDVSGFDPGHVGPTVSITSLGVPGWGLSDYKDLIDDVFNVWASVANLTNLGEVADGGADAGALDAAGGHLGDIRVAAWEIGASGVLAHAFQPGTEAIFGPGGSIAGDIHFDLFAAPGVPWLWVDDPFDAPGDLTIDIYTVALHEMGHALGLAHTGVFGAVMEPVYAGARRTLSADDIAGIQAIYGVKPAVPDAGSAGAMLLMSFLFLARRRSDKK